MGISHIIFAMPQFVVVGAGISGLATAFHLQERLPKAEITVLEAAGRPGGTIWTERIEGFQVEVGANGFLDTKPSTLQLCEQLGIRDRLISASDAAQHRYLFLDGRLLKLPEGLWSFLRSPLLSWRSKWAIFRERSVKPRADDVDESVHDFIARRTTPEVAEVFGDALVTGIYAGDPHLLSMGAAFPRIVEFERRHGSILAGMRHAAKVRRAQAEARGETYDGGGRLLSFREGLRLLIETLSVRLRRPPLLGVRVRHIARESLEDSARWIVQGDGQDRWTADAVLLVCPAFGQAELLQNVDPRLAEQIGGIAYSPAIVVALGYRREQVPHSLEGFGYIAPQRARRDILGVQWCSSIFPERAPEGMVLLRAIAGGWHRHDIMTWDDRRLLEAVRKEIKLAMGIEAPPVFQHIVRWDKAIPQYHLGHAERVALIERQAATHPGLFLTGNAYHGVALNDCTEQAERVAARIADFVSAG